MESCVCTRNRKTNKKANVGSPTRRCASYCTSSQDASAIVKMPCCGSVKPRVQGAVFLEDFYNARRITGNRKEATWH